MSTPKVSVRRRDGWSKSIIIRDKTTGDAISPTGYRLYFTVKRNKKDTDAQAVIQKTITNPTIITLTGKTGGDTDIEPRIYWADFEVRDTSDVPTTYGPFAFEIVQDVTIGAA